MSVKVIHKVEVTLERGGHLGRTGNELMTHTIGTIQPEAEVKAMVDQMCAEMRGHEDNYQIVVAYEDQAMIYGFHLTQGRLAWEIRDCLCRWILASQMLLHNTTRELPR